MLRGFCLFTFPGASQHPFLSWRERSLDIPLPAAQYHKQLSTPLTHVSCRFLNVMDYLKKSDSRLTHKAGRTQPWS